MSFFDRFRKNKKKDEPQVEPQKEEQVPVVQPQVSEEKKVYEPIQQVESDTQKFEQPTIEQAPVEQPKEENGFWGKLWKKPSQEEIKEDLDQGLEKTKSGLFEKFTKAVAGKSTVDDELLDEIEAILIQSDVGLETTIKIIERLEAKVAEEKFFSTKELYRLLKEVVVDLLSENNTYNQQDYEFPDKGKYPYVVMVVGVNGVGKTTTIGKLAAKAKAQGKKVVLGAGDTFRAAAISQLQVWGERVGVTVAAKEMGSDPASVAYEAVKTAMDMNADVVFVDTAGRLHNKVGLMNELTKIKRVMQKIVPEVPHDVLLVLDASTGQNAMEQAKEFTAATQVSKIAITKLDGTAKGGVVLGIADQFKIPISYIGVGEQVHHLQLFNKENFVESLFG